MSFADPEVKLIDLTGDGLTDVLRTGTSFECYFNDRDPDQAWDNDKPLGQIDHSPRHPTTNVPDVRFSDPRVRTADMTGDGLQDIVLVHSGSIDYWPNLVLRSGNTYAPEPTQPNDHCVDVCSTMRCIACARLLVLDGLDWVRKPRRAGFGEAKVRRRE